MHLEWPLFRWTSFIIGAGVAFTLLVAFFYLVITRDFYSAGSTIVAVSATYTALAALFFSRGAALPPGPSKVRSLYAAERTTQAITFTLVGVLQGVVIFSCGSYYENSMRLDSSQPQLWLAFFFIPLLFFVLGYRCFFAALKVICREFFHPLHTRDIARRIKSKR